MTAQWICKGCWVARLSSDGGGQRGIVRSNDELSEYGRVAVEWIRPRRSIEVVRATELKSGFQLGMDIIDCPRKSHRPSLGQGQIVGLRTLGHQDQVLVDFISSGQRLWLPFGQLAQIKGVRHRLAVGQLSPDSERFRLRLLASAIKNFNEKTGAFSHLDIDPLPHQIHLVHHILASGSLNWLIADDVGLGKTIEAGMLMAALEQRGQLRRVLLISPAGLTKQWKEELDVKFGLDDFEIYGRDFFIDDPKYWKLHDRVIASMDRLKAETHLESVLRAEPWDLVVIDEGHRLSRRQYGMKFEAADRFKMAAAIRGKARAMVLLTATPHQGMQDKFTALLELLRPERKDEIESISIEPEIIGEMVYRNYKADVTDLDGKFIFKGKTTRTLAFEANEMTLEFDEALKTYLRNGYRAIDELGGIRGRAIGFVMTVYRKLAASSSAAILNALQNRKRRLQESVASDELTPLLEDDENRQERYAGEFEEAVAAGEAVQFFEGEMEQLDELISKAATLSHCDQKIEAFMGQLIPQLLEEDPDRKILIFTEYRSTQNLIARELVAKYGDQAAVMLNGSMDLDDRRDAIRQFDEQRQFLISTEAGGEGINLQRNCFTMINFDLPWNPMRLVQRVGRLYRYGQQHRVVVFNLQMTGTLDEDVVHLMYQRLNAVVADMASVGRDEFNAGLHEDILGEVVELLDVKDVIESARTEGINRSRERIDEALKRARDAAEKQREIFAHAAGFRPEEMLEELTVDARHLQSFFRGMSNILGIEIVESLHGGEVLSIRIPETLQEKLGLRRTRFDVCFRRDWSTRRANTEMMDLASPIMAFLIESAMHYSFGGLACSIRADGYEIRHLIAMYLRWQTDDGRRNRQDFVVYDSDGKATKRASRDLLDWLLVQNPNPPAEMAIDGRELIETVERQAHRDLAEPCDQYLHPESMEYIAAGVIP